MTSPGSCRIACGWASWALEDGICGDLHVAEDLAEGSLLAVIDGLGHGAPAAEASHEAARILRSHADNSVEELFRLCHDGLRRTRGAAMTIVKLDTRASMLAWCGVGNVEAVLVRQAAALGRNAQAIVARGGVVGYRMPPLRVTSLPIHSGDALLLASDGVRSDFFSSVDPAREPQDLADELLHGYAKGSDDALVLVARYGGAG